MPKTTLTTEQFTEVVALGSVGEVRELANDGYSFDDIKAILETQRASRLSDKDSELSAQAKANAQATKQAMRPENERHPGKSVYSYPEGDVERPRPAFKCKMYWLAEELGYDVTTAQEIELMNRIQPGEYRCTRPDGSAMKVKVTVEHDDATGKAQTLKVWFETKGGLHKILSSRVAMLKEILEQQSALVPA